MKQIDSKLIEVIDNDYVKIPIKKVKPNSYNNNVMIDRILETLKRSIKKDGFNQPILVKYVQENDYYEIIDGEHRLKAMKLLGEKYITAKVLNVDKLKQKLMTLSFNKLRGKEDYKKTQKLFESIENEFDVDIQKLITEEAGYTETEIKVFMSKIEDDLDEINTKISQEYFDIEKYEKNIKEIKLSRNIKYGDVFQLGDHKISVGNPKNKKDISLLLNMDRITVCNFKIPIEDITINEATIHLWIDSLFNNLIDFMDSDSSLFVEMPNLINSEGNKSLYDLTLINHLINIYKFKYKDTIILLDDYGKWINLTNGYSSLHHFVKTNSYKFNELSFVDYTNDIDSVIKRSFFHKKTNNVEKRLPMNVLCNNTILRDSPCVAINYGYSDEYDVVFEPFVYNINKLLACEFSNRCYRGLVLSGELADMLITAWEKFTKKKAKIIFSLSDE